MQEDVILTLCTPVALKSAASHINHDQCYINGKNNVITITYPTFSHTITTDNQFEFPITLGTNSSLPILWSPNHSFSPPVTFPKTKSKTQQLASKRIALSHLPLTSITEERDCDIELTAPSTLPPTHSKHVAHNHNSITCENKFFPSISPPKLQILETIRVEEKCSSPAPVPSTQ